MLAERPVKDDFDRSVQPKAADAVSVKVPAIWRGKLDKGIDIIGTHSDEIPAVSIMIATNVAIDSLGTATNVTGDGAIAVAIDRFYKKSEDVDDNVPAEDPQPSAV